MASCRRAAPFLANIALPSISTPLTWGPELYSYRYRTAPSLPPLLARAGRRVPLTTPDVNPERYPGYKQGSSIQLRYWGYSAGGPTECIVVSQRPLIVESGRLSTVNPPETQNDLTQYPETVNFDFGPITHNGVTFVPVGIWARYATNSLTPRGSADSRPSCRCSTRLAARRPQPSDAIHCQLQRLPQAHSHQRDHQMTPPNDNAENHRTSDADLEILLARAAEEGAHRNLADVGLGGKGAVLRIHDMRSLLECISFVRRTAVQTAVHVITTGILIALLTGIAMKLRWFGRAREPQSL